MIAKTKVQIQKNTKLPLQYLKIVNLVKKYSVNVNLSNNKSQHISNSLIST